MTQLSRRHFLKVSAAGTATAILAGCGGERWVESRATFLTRAGQRLASQRARIMQAAQLQRHHRVLDLHAGSGLLTWEALRRAPEGNVVALARSAQEAEALRQQASRLPELERPTILQGDLDALPALLDAQPPTPEAPAAPDGPDASPITHHATRFDLSTLDERLAQQVVEAEEAIYSRPDDPMVNWNEAGLQRAFEAAGLVTQVSVEREASQVQVTPAMLARWFTPAPSGERPAYIDHLRGRLDAAECAQVEALFRQQLTNRAAPWETTMLYLTAAPQTQQAT